MNISVTFDANQTINDNNNMEKSMNELFSELNEKLDGWYYISDLNVKCAIFGIKDHDYYLEWNIWIDGEWDEFTIDKKLRAFNDFDKLNKSTL